MTTTTKLQQKRWTAESFFAWVDPADETRYEVLNGRLVMMAAPELSHQDVVFNIAVALRRYAKQNDSGKVYIAPVDVVLGDDVVEPDVLYISRDRMDIAKRKRIIGAPDLIVEVLSTSTAKRDLRYKWEIYAANGVREYWIVDPAGSVEVLKLVDGAYETHVKARRDEVIHSHLLEGFTMAGEAVFEA